MFYLSMKKTEYDPKYSHIFYMKDFYPLKFLDVQTLSPNL